MIFIFFNQIMLHDIFLLLKLLTVKDFIIVPIVLNFTDAKTENNEE
jgi:hypothetical protein